MVDQKTRDKILQVKDLYTLPQTLVEVLRVTDSPQTSAQDLSRIILRDGPITARVLRMANSAFYGRAGSVNTVHQAIVLLGFRSIKSLVLSTALFDVFGNKDTGCAYDLTGFWQHSLETAGIAQLLAGRIGYQPQEEAFVAGLLHDLGLLIMSRAFGDEYRQVVSAASSVEDWCASERERFGIDHPEAAAILFAEWGLPEQLVQAVGQHHDPPLGAQGPNLDRLALLVSLADRVGHLGVEPHGPVSRLQIELKHRIVGVLGLRPADLSMVDRWVSENFSAIAVHLDIQVGSPVEILTHANQRLYELYQETERALLESPGGDRDKLAKEIIDAVCGTFSHHINNATTTIMGNAELVELAVRRGLLSDPDARLVEAMKLIENAVFTISAVLTEMKLLNRLDVVSYHDRAQILNIEERVKRRSKDPRPF